LHKWRYPSLSIHGIQGAFDGTGAKTGKSINLYVSQFIKNMCFFVLKLFQEK